MMAFMRKIFAGLFILMTSLAVCIADDLPNKLMELDFEPISSDLVNVVVKTERPYNDNISITKKDAYTYVVTLPNTDSLAPNPDWSKTSRIESVSIRTMPSSGSGNGYTKITIKTNSNMSFIGKNTLYEKSDRPDDVYRRREPDVVPPLEKREQPKSYQNISKNTTYSSERKQIEQTYYQKTERTAGAENKQTFVKPKAVSNVEETDKEIVIKDDLLAKRQENSQKNHTEKILIILGIILVIFVSIYCYIRAKNKLTDIVGEKLEIDVEEDDKSKKKEESSKKSLGGVKKTIRELDKKYPNPAAIPNISTYNQPAPVMSSEKSTDDMNIVDLDALFNEQKTQEISDENDALEDFLSDFSFDEVNDQDKDNDEQEELYKIDEDEYRSVINDDTLKFTQSDMECIEQIINSDISSETLNNISKYVTTNPIKETPRQSLDELVAAYTISQNITFSGEDIRALDKLMRVELDDDFVKDLRTDPKRLAAMEKEMLDFENVERKKPNEVKTLKVADLLPNLSDVLANPSKYAENEEPKAKVDESALWKNIENVTFKPFDDGTREFEILNKFDEETQENVIELYTKDFLEEKNKEVNDVNKKPEVKIQEVKKPELKKPLQPQKIVPKEEPKKELQPKINEVDRRPNLKCIMDGKTYNVLSSIALVKGIGCHLAKSDDGYSVLSYSGNNVSLLKTYPAVSSSKIQARLSEKLGNGEYRFIIRIGNVKFIAELKNRCINYVMDL